MIAATWVWALVGILVFLGLGIVAALLLGLLDLPGSVVRRAGQAASAPRVEGGRPLPDEVPDRTAEEVAEEADGGR